MRQMPNAADNFRRIAIRKEAFSKRRELLMTDDEDTDIECGVYGSETWTMRKEDIKRL